MSCRVIFLILFLFSCQKNKEKEEASKEASQTNTEVGITKVELRPFALQMQANGIIKAQQQSQLFFKATGEIEHLYTHNAATVQAGQTLAVLDNRQAVIAILQAQEQIKKAGLALNKLLIEYGGNDLDTLSIKPRFLENIKIQSGFYEAQTALKNARLQFDNSILKAPYGGIVANLKTKEHNQASLSEAFCTILANKNIAVEASILESELAVVALGQSAKIMPLAMNNQIYQGQVYEINPQVSPQGLVAIKVKILNPDNKLLDGMNARLVIEKTMGKQLVIPKSAVVDRGGRKVVFTVENGLAKWHYVVIAHENENSVSISEGLKASEVIITSGNLNLGHDAKVEIKKD